MAEIEVHYGPASEYIHINRETGYVKIGECELTHTEWSSLKRRVDKVLSRTRFCEARDKPAATPRGTKFILKNLVTLNDVQRGYVKPAPKFLRRWFDWVITKEDYGS